MSAAPPELLNPALAGVPVYVTADVVDGAVRLASNEHPTGPSQHVLDALRTALTDVHRYPDPAASWLRVRIARHLGRRADEVLVGNGATELLALIAQAFVGPGQNAIHVAPSFVMYRIAPLSVGAEVREVPAQAGVADLDAILDRVDADTRLVYLANPNNPTGTYVSEAELTAFAAALPAHVVLVVDEAYREYAVASDFPNAESLLDRRERIIVVRTFSKCHGLAALRIGYLLAPPPLIAGLDRARLPFNVNAPAQIAAAAALEDDLHVARTCAANRVGMDWLAPRLRALGCDVTPSQANFLLVDLGWDGGVVALANRGVLVRSMAPYGLPSHARITVGTQTQNQALVAALEAALAERRA